MVVFVWVGSREVVEPQPPKEVSLSSSPSSASSRIDALVDALEVDEVRVRSRDCLYLKEGKKIREHPTEQKPPQT